MTDQAAASRSAAQEAVLHLAQCVRFYSRIPVPALPFETDPHAIPDFSRAARMLPLAALFIALPGAATLLVSGLIWPPMIAATLAVMVMVATTGAFHEDGLADTADGFGGGFTIARKLDIMTDSRIGTYGAAALILGLVLRVLLLASLIGSFGGVAAALCVLAIAGPSRVAGLIPLWLLAPAKPDGKSAAVGRPGRDVMRTAIVLTLIIAIVMLALGDIHALSGILALAACLAVAWPMIVLSRRMIQGQTGDVAGATQQVSELAFLLVLAAKMG